MYQQEVKELTEIKLVTTPINKTIDFKNQSIKTTNNHINNSSSRNNSSDLEYKKVGKDIKKYVYVRPQLKDDLLIQANNKMNENIKKETESDKY